MELIRKMKKSFLSLLYVLLLFLVGCNEDQKSENVVVFEDANFEKFVRNAIKETIHGEFEGPISKGFNRISTIKNA
jgi:hypothetical protein